jgi:phenylacetate-CoA ligase
VQQACQNSDFYCQRFKQAGLTPEDLKTPEDFRLLPIFRKEDIRDRLELILAKNISTNRLVKTATGGTTGSSFIFYRDMDCHLQRQAIDLVYNLWADWKTGDKIAILWGAPQDLIGYPAFKQKLKNVLIDRTISLDFFQVSPHSLREFALKMMRFQPKIIYGYSQAVYLLAQYAQQNLSGQLKVKSAVCTAEPLYPSQREFIEKTFECEVFDRYASREFGLIASECCKHSGYHLMADSVYLEILKEGKPAQPGETGEIVITDLLNYGMPFIRYRIGDLGAWEEKECPCGCKLPMLKNLVGRDTDFLVTQEGGVISGVAIMALLTQYGSRTGIAQMQIIQTALQEITVKVVRGPKFSPSDILHLKTTLHKLFGSPARIEFEFVSEIPKEKSGKFRYTISYVKPGLVQS